MTEPAKEKMAPVQGFVGGIPWSLHLEAYNAYCKKWSPQPALIDLEGRNCRGGFGTGELDEFIPGWRDKVSEIGILKAELAGLRAKVAQQAALVEKCMAAMNENADRGEKAEAKLAALEGQEPFGYWWTPDGTFDIGQEPVMSSNKGPCSGWRITPMFLAAGAASEWNDFVEIACARIKSADDAAADGDYMLDSSDCIKVLRGTWGGNYLNDHPVLPAAGAAPVPCVVLTPEDRAAFERFHETWEDNEGYDVPKEMMKRLAEVGVVHHITAGRYDITKFGHYVLAAGAAPKELT